MEILNTIKRTGTLISLLEYLIWCKLWQIMNVNSSWLYRLYPVILKRNKKLFFLIKKSVLSPK